MERPWLHRYAVLLAVCTLVVLLTGASFSPSEERPLYSFGHTHSAGGMVVVALTIGLAIWISLADRRGWLRRLAWLTVAVALLEGGLGFVEAPRPPAVKLSHTLLALLFFSGAVAVALFTSRGWHRGPEPVQGRPLLRTLAVATGVAVLGQVALGAAYRHQALGLMPHIAGALVVALLILVMGIFVMQNFPAHRSLRPCAIALMTIVFVQVFLGLTVLTIASIAADNAMPLVLPILAHVATGGLTLAVTIVFVILVRRDCRS